MNNPFEQSYLAGFAPKKSLDNYAKGADPRVINDIIALSELKEQAAMRQRAALASGAAQGQMPTVRDKIIQMFQQANQPRQQPQQQPNPMAQGIMAQAPQEVPQEAQMYHGGVARLPVNDRMFGYANGGIIAFKKGEEVPKAEVPLENPEFDPEGTPRSRSEREEIEAQNARLRALESNAQELGNLRARRMAGLGAINPTMVERMDQYYKPRRPDITDLSQVETNGARPSNVVGASQDAAAAARTNFAATDPRRVGIAQNVTRSIAPNAASPSAGPGGPTPPTKPPVPATGTGIDQLLQQQQARLTAQANAPKMPEPDLLEGGIKYAKAQDKYVRETEDSEAAKRLYKVYDDMAKRARADDDAQAAQRAEDARNNLWSFLSNTRGSSLGVAAGKADAALQPLLAEQKKANAEYRKYSYERDMNRNKADAEARMAEEARKRGEFAKAIEHEQKQRAYLLEVRKADQQAEHYRNTEINQALQTQATLQASREGHITQLEVAKINKAAQMAGYNKPSESERVYEKYISIRDSKGQKAADEFLNDQDKVRGTVGGAKYLGAPEKDQTRAYYQSLYQDPNYAPMEDKIRRLEAKPKLTEKEQQTLAAARAYVKRKQEELRRDFRLEGGAGDTGGARVISEADIQATMRSSGQSREAVIAAAKARGYTIQ